MDDIIDLGERRRRKEWPGEDRDRTRIEAIAGRVEFLIDVRGRDPETLVTTAGHAEVLAHALLRAARGARKQQKEPCQACGERGCPHAHVGQRRRGWRKGRRIEAVVVRLCRRSTRMQDVETGENFYTQSLYNWHHVGWGGLRSVPEKGS